MLSAVVLHLGVFPRCVTSIVESSTQETNEIVGRVGTANIDLVGIILRTSHEREAIKGQLARVRKALSNRALRNGLRVRDCVSKLSVGGNIDLLAAGDNSVHAQAGGRGVEAECCDRVIGGAGNVFWAEC